MQIVHHFFYTGTCIGLDTAYTGSYRAFGYNLYHTDVARSGYVRTTTELDGRAELDDADVVAVLLTEEGDGAQFLGFLDRNVAVFLQRNVGADLGVDQMLYLTQLLIGHLLEV